MPIRRFLLDISSVFNNQSLYTNVFIMNRELRNKVVAVTGGADGLGYAICDQYLEQDAKTVIIIDIDEAQGKKALTALTSKHGEKIAFIQGDVIKDLDRIFKIIVDTYKSIDVLVQVAGIADDSIPKRMIDIHLTAVIEWCLKFKEIMRTDRGNGKGGTMILISSIYGFRVIPFAAVYQASKFGVLGFAKSMGHSRNFEKTGIRVVALCPGFTESKQTEQLLDPKYLETIEEDFLAYLKEQVWQKADAVGGAALEIFKRADSGTVWIIEGGKLTERKESG